LRSHLGVCAFRQLDTAEETAVRPHRSIVAFAPLFVFVATLTRNIYGIVSDFHVDVILCQTWQVSANDEFALTFECLDLWRP
jgi:hypothetical protein